MRSVDDFCGRGGGTYEANKKLASTTDIKFVGLTIEAIESMSLTIEAHKKSSDNKADLLAHINSSRLLFIAICHEGI